jgi:hypothetical protein
MKYLLVLVLALAPACAPSKSYQEGCIKGLKTAVETFGMELNQEAAKAFCAKAEKGEV